MPNTAFMIASDSAGDTNSASFAAVWFIDGDITTGLQTSTESTVQVVTRDAGTYHGFFARATANTATGTNTMTFRKNAGNGNETVNFAGGTGTFQDTTHIDAVVATDKVNYQTSAVSTNSTTITVTSILFDSTTNFAIRKVQTNIAGQAYTSGSDFAQVAGRLAAATSEAGILYTNKKAATMKFGQATTTANAKTATMTYQSRKNSANGVIAITIATAAGVNEDTTHSDTLISGDTWDWETVNGTDTTHAATFSIVAIDYQTSTGNFFLVFCGADADVATTANSTVFAPIGGGFAFTATESNVQSNALGAILYTHLCAQQTNTSGSTCTVRFRSGTANANQTVTTGTGAGTSEDTTHIDAVFSSTIVDYSATAGAATASNLSKIYVYGYFWQGAFAYSFNASNQFSASFGDAPPIFG